MSDVVITSLQEFFKKFAWYGVAKYQSEKVALLVQKINAVAERLAEVPTLPRDKTLIILTGLTNCSVTEFFGPFELMLNTERAIQLENDGDMHDDRKCLERLKNLTLLASKSFQYLNISNNWKIPSNHRHRMEKGKGPCDNCGGENYSPYFPYLHEKAKIKKAKEERAACRGGGGRNDICGGVCCGRHQGDRNN